MQSCLPRYRTLAKTLVLYAFAVCFFLPQAARATSVDPINEPAQIERRLEPRIEEPARPTPGITAPAPSPAQKHSYKGSFTLKGIEFRGATVYNEAELMKLADGMIGTKVTLDALNPVAEAVERRYRADGYLLIVARVADGAPKNGVAVIQVAEGYIGNVVIDGRMTANKTGQKLVSDIARKITMERPLKTATLERYLLLIDDLPGVTAKGVVRRGAGGVELVIVMDHDKYETSGEINNRGTRFIGPTQFQGTFAANSLFGLYERTLVRGVTAAPTSALRFFDIQHEQQIGTEGTKLKFFASHTDAEPGDTLKAAMIEGRATEFQVQLESPVIRSRRENLTPRISFSALNSEVTTLKVVEIFEDKLRVLRAGALYDTADRWNGVNVFDAEISQGLDMFGATEKGAGRSRIDGEEDFTKVTLDVTRLQPLPDNFSVLTSFTGQYAFDPLLSSEEFLLGGIGFGQAYDPSELTGDHGAAAKVELRWANAVGEPWLESYQIYTYYDIGVIWQKDPPPAVIRTQSLASAGIGVRSNFNENLSGTIEVAKPLTRDVSAEGNAHPRIFFGLIGRF